MYPSPSMKLVETTTSIKRVADSMDMANKKSKRAKIDVSPLQTDILFFGNKKMTCMHPGNEAFADVVRRYVKKIKPSENKLKVSQGIVDGLASHIPPVRFLVCNKESKDWTTLSKTDAILITNHALMTAERQLEQRKDAMVVSKYGETSWQTHFYRIFRCDPMVETLPRRADAIPDVIEHWHVSDKESFHDEAIALSPPLEVLYSEDVLEFDVFERLPLPTVSVEPLPLTSDLSTRKEPYFSSTERIIEGPLQTWSKDVCDFMMDALDCNVDSKAFLQCSC
mmetsp:Transcript_19167/g.31802  ORF Transcript_19167/g.31802 Transcript_19167/m.31802 type:complete len:281 (+) Transcript_19167:85-927(+)